MNYLLLLVGFFLAFANSVNGHTPGHCSATNRMAMARCYQDYLKSFGIGTDDISVKLFQQKLNEKISTWKGIEQVCLDFTSLKKCIDDEIINDCMNIQEFKKLTMSLEKNAAETYVSHFYATNYACNDGFQNFKNSYLCLKHANISCDTSSTPMECSAQENAIENFAEKVKNECGQSAFDFTKTIKTIELCHILSDCDICKKQKFSIGKKLLKVLGNFF